MQAVSQIREDILISKNTKNVLDVFYFLWSHTQDTLDRAIWRNMGRSRLVIQSHTSKVGPRPEDIGSCRLGQLDLKQADVLLGAFMIYQPGHWEPVFFYLCLSLETTADKVCIQVSSPYGFRISPGYVARHERYEVPLTLQIRWSSVEPPSQCTGLQKEFHLYSSSFNRWMDQSLNKLGWDFRILMICEDPTFSIAFKYH